MSTILVDQYGRPLAADAIGPMYGPTPFGDQPRYVRRRGRKGLAKSTRAGRRRKKASWARAAGRAVPSYRASTSRRGRKSSRRGSRSRTGYREFLAARSGTYGPVAFSDQPTWVRARGRKSKARKGASRRLGRKRTSARSSMSSRRGMTRRQKRKMNRALARSTSKRSRRGSKRRSSKRRSSRSGSTRRSSSRRSLSRRGSTRKARRAMTRRGSTARVLTYNKLMQSLRRKPKLKAWVCVGRTRTGCGGGRKGRRGSRQLGILRP